MKILWMFFLLISCGQRENAWDELSQDEQDYIRTEERAKCIASVTDWSASFITNSNAQITAGTSWARNKYYVHEFKEGSATEAEFKNYIYTYKQDSQNNAFYLLVKQVPRTGDQVWFFLRVTTLENENFIATLKNQLCAEDSTISATQESSVMKIKKVDIAKGSEGENLIFYNETVNYNLSEPSIIATLFKMDRVRRLVDEDNKEVSKKNYSHTFTTTTEKFVTNPQLIISGGIPRLDQDGNGNLSVAESGLVIYFCETPADYTFPIEFTPSQCQSNTSGIPALWDLSL